MTRSTFVPTSRLLRAAALLAGLAALGACAPVHPRVWQNGEAMSNSSAYRQSMAGDHSFATQKRLYYGSSGLSVFSRDVPYPTFGHW